MVHDYAAIDDALVWQYVTGDVPELVGTLHKLADQLRELARQIYTTPAGS